LNCAHVKLAGDLYTRAILASSTDRRVRTAFQAMVASIVTPGATILDFGAGTGLDAQIYAGLGHRVLAYDPDPQMCGAFRQQCRHGLDAGQIELVECDYRGFIAGGTLFSQPAALVTANFAPFNLIDDVNELFGRLHALTVPRGRILLSVLSPLFVGDIRYRWWWRNLTRLWQQGHFTVGESWTVTRRSAANFALLAAPYFGLAGIGRGWPGSPLQRTRRPSLMTSRYMFLLFEKL
jgi:SAM-dependent methyltransferase